MSTGALVVPGVSGPATTAGVAGSRGSRAAPLPYFAAFAARDLLVALAAGASAVTERFLMSSYLTP